MNSVLKLLVLPLLFLFAQLSVALAQSTTSEGQHDGIYEVRISRIWIDSYWKGRNDPAYKPGKANLIQAAKIEVRNNKARFLKLEANNALAGPAFSNFRGRVNKDGVLRFSVTVNKLLGAGTNSPFTLRPSVQLSARPKVGDIATAKPRGFDEAFQAHVAVKTLELFANPKPKVATESSSKLVVSGEDERLRTLIQPLLSELGYYDGDIDGLAGPQTRRAIRTFESVTLGPDDGVLDENEIAKLIAQAEARRSGPRKSAASTSKQSETDKLASQLQEQQLAQANELRESLGISAVKQPTDSEDAQALEQLAAENERLRLELENAKLRQQIAALEQQLPSNTDVAPTADQSKALKQVVIEESQTTKDNTIESAVINFDGLYRPRGAEFAHWDCESVGQDGGALSIRGNKLTLIEEACTLSDPTENKETSEVSYDAQCAIEGSEYDAKYSFRKTDFGVVFSGEEFAAEWQSCATPDDLQKKVSKEQDEHEGSSGDAGALELVAQWHQANGHCRGGSGNSQVTLDWCETRSSIGEVLEGIGWCFDQDGKTMSEKGWRQCDVSSSELLERQRAQAEQAERERTAAEQAERERIAAEQKERGRVAADKADRERRVAENAERERLAGENSKTNQLVNGDFSHLNANQLLDTARASKEKKDLRTSIIAYREAINKNSSTASIELAAMYFSRKTGINDEHLKKDGLRAASILYHEAQSGHAEAMFLLSDVNLYHLGQKAEFNAWLRQSLLAGSVSAALRYGEAYRTGRFDAVASGWDLDRAVTYYFWALLQNKSEVHDAMHYLEQITGSSAEKIREYASIYNSRLSSKIVTANSDTISEMARLAEDLNLREIAFLLWSISEEVGLSGDNKTEPSSLLLKDAENILTRQKVKAISKASRTCIEDAVQDCLLSMLDDISSSGPIPLNFSMQLGVRSQFGVPLSLPKRKAFAGYPAGRAPREVYKEQISVAQNKRDSIANLYREQKCALISHRVLEKDVSFAGDNSSAFGEYMEIIFDQSMKYVRTELPWLEQGEVTGCIAELNRPFQEFSTTEFIVSSKYIVALKYKKLNGVDVDVNLHDLETGLSYCFAGVRVLGEKKKMNVKTRNCSRGTWYYPMYGVQM